jgi:long-chain acyl-CoA synthetase
MRMECVAYYVETPFQHNLAVVRDTLIDFFEDFARAPGEFLVYDDGFRTRRYTYREVARAARAFARRLSGHGLTDGDKVVFWSENRPEWIVALWGCLLNGLVVVPVDYRASAEFLVRVSRIVAARLVLVGQDVSPPAIDGSTTWNFSELEWPSSDEGPPSPSVAITRDHVAEIIFTSGATADPKGVVITHRNILANIVPVEREVIKYRRWGRPFFPLRFLNLLPLSHMFGQAMATFIPPMIPGTVVFMRGYNPIDIVAQIKTRRVSVLVSVPKILDVLREHIVRVAPEANPQAVEAATTPGEHVARRWWRYRRIHRQFGWKFWCFVVGAAPLESELEAFWSQLGFLVVQGYGLTETAPIVTLNHPFGTRKGSVGKAIAGVEMKIAPDGEILVRGDNVTTGYFNAEDETAHAFEDGWFHTGDIGEIGPTGELFIRGRKKEMIVTPEGLNVFPEDVERVLNHVTGVRESAVVGVTTGGQERVHAALVVDSGVDPDRVAREANAQLEEHQKIRRAVIWPDGELPRTEGTRKLKRAAIAQWMHTGAPPRQPSTATDKLTALIAKRAGRGELLPATTIEELGLSSLERVELMVALEDAFQTHLDEAAFSGVQDLGQLRELVDRASAGDGAAAEPIDFPSWSRSLPARAVRRASLPTWLLPLTRVFAWIHVEGRERLRSVEGPVIFASNHQSHMDTPVILAALPGRFRYRVAVAMAKEFFKAHFFPEQYGRMARFTNSLNYYLAALMFNAFPLPQREAGARQTLRYIGEVLGEGFSVLIFPEGHRTERGEIDRFRPGIGMIASRLAVPVVPVRLDGLERVLHQTWRMARPGRVRVAFGSPLILTGDNYEQLAKQVENAVKAL